MGEVFAGRYELVDPIGRGGVGAVWRAWDHRRRRYVAAKVLRQSDAHTLLRFVREQAVRVDHPHVLAPASWAADDDKVLFTMDLVRGGSLAHLIGDYGPLPPRFVCLLLDQLLAGLAAVHGEGVVHRDIKPANVLLEATGTGRPHLRLSDFGISLRKGEPRLTDADFVVGTPGYFAPEQMLGAEPDFPADLFAVGLLALYLLTGERPDGEALAAAYPDSGVPPAPARVPEPLWQVLAGLLQPDPEARFRTATGARKALAEAAELLPELDPAEEPVEVFDQLGPLPTGFGPEGPEREEREERQERQERTGGVASSYENVRPGQGTGPGTGPRPAGGAAGPAGPAGEPAPAYVPGATGYAPPAAHAAAAAAPGPAGPGTAPPPAPAAVPAPPHPADPVAATGYGVAPPAAPQPPTPTAPYTTAQPQPQPQPPAQAAQAPVPGGGVPGRRPGPPTAVAVPVALLAVLLIAVGVWALVSG